MTTNHLDACDFRAMHRRFILWHRVRWIAIGALAMFVASRVL